MKIEGMNKEKILFGFIATVEIFLEKITGLL